MDIHFGCTMCGKCCHGLKLPLSIDEALAWAERGGTLQVLCEAIPWPAEPAADDLQAQHKRRRSFEAASGTLPIRVIAILVATFDGACPNLQPDMRCGIYEERPVVCRIYPAEINPFLSLMPERKACPPEAWSPDQPVLTSQNRVMDAQTFALIEQSRAMDVRDAAMKRRVCAYLGIETTALSNDGFVIHSPATDRMIAALRRTVNDHGDEIETSAWTFVSNRSSTLEALSSVDALSRPAAELDAAQSEYLGFFPAS
jgi:Fe-S-cluster containining protein